MEYEIFEDFYMFPHIKLAFIFCHCTGEEMFLCRKYELRCFASPVLVLVPDCGLDTYREFY